MNKVFCGIINNTNNDTSKLKDILKSKLIEYKEYNQKQNNASICNKIITYAQENNYKYCFIIKSDIEILDNNVFQKYIDLNEKMNIGVSFFGYYNENIILSNKPSPILKLKVSDNEYVYINRHDSNGFICLDLDKIKTHRFNEKLNFLEFKLFLHECCEIKIIPSMGFYFDIEESWKYIKLYYNKDIVNTPLIMLDKRYLANNQIHINFEKTGDKIINYVKEKYNLQ